jgi:coproporphyrinogen III oxidase
MTSDNIKTQFVDYIQGLQDTICIALEQADGKEQFIEDKWEREGGGGGITRVIGNGAVFEKGGVNTSVVSGVLPDTMKAALKVSEGNFFACGLSLVLHPLNPYLPTVHANWRYFELYNNEGKKVDSWFGGGSDLTPYYIFKEDGKHFHTVLKQTMDRFGVELFPKYKQQCDEYFTTIYVRKMMKMLLHCWHFSRQMEIVSSMRTFQS